MQMKGVKQPFRHSEITRIEALKVTHRTALAQLDALFASLQQRAFAGEL